MDLSHPANDLLGADLDTADKIFVVPYPLTKILVALVIAIYGVYLTTGNDLFHLGVALLKNLNHLFKPSGATILKKMIILIPPSGVMFSLAKAPCYRACRR
jgi:hypothetical protein